MLKRGVKYNFVAAFVWNADSVFVKAVRCEIKYCNNFIAVFVNSSKGDYAVCVVFTGNPLEAVPTVINLSKCRRVFIKFINGFGKSKHLPVHFIVKKEPIKPLLIVPFNKLTEFTAHKQKLFAGMSKHICKKQP